MPNPNIPSFSSELYSLIVRSFFISFFHWFFSSLHQEFELPVLLTRDPPLDHAPSPLTTSVSQVWYVWQPWPMVWWIMCTSHKPEATHLLEEANSYSYSNRAYWPIDIKTRVQQLIHKIWCYAICVECMTMLPVPSIWAFKINMKTKVIWRHK